MHEKAQNKPTQKLILGLILASFATVRAGTRLLWQLLLDYFIRPR